MKINNNIMIYKRIAIWDFGNGAQRVHRSKTFSPAMTTLLSADIRGLTKTMMRSPTTAHGKTFENTRH